MSNRLLVNPGSPQAWEINLQSGLNRIGSAPENDFIISHPSIAPTHCEITVTDQAVFIKDLASPSGTFVERVPVTEIQLYPGQHVQCGAVKMIFESSIAPVLPEPINLPGSGARIIPANFGPAAPTPPQPPGTSRIQRATELQTAAETASQPTAHAPPPADDVPTSGGAPAKTQFIRGVCGAASGGLIGLFIWFWLVKTKNSDFGWVAWAVGAIAGLGGRILAPPPNRKLGLICGACSLLAILGGDYFVAQHLGEHPGLFAVLWLFLGMITAYKIGADERD